MRAAQITWECKKYFIQKMLFIKHRKTQIQTEFGSEKTFKIS